MTVKPTIYAGNTSNTIQLFPNSNTVGLNFQTYKYIIIIQVHVSLEWNRWIMGIYHNFRQYHIYNMSVIYIVKGTGEKTIDLPYNNDNKLDHIR